MKEASKQALSRTDIQTGIERMVHNVMTELGLDRRQAITILGVALRYCDKPPTPTNTPTGNPEILKSKAA